MALLRRTAFILFTTTGNQIYRIFHDSGVHEMANHIWNVEVLYHIRRSLVIWSIWWHSDYNLQSTDRVGGPFRFLWPYSLYRQPFSMCGGILFHLDDFIAINRWRTFKWYDCGFVNFRDCINTSTVHRTVTDLRVICNQICVYVTALLQLGILIFFSLKRNSNVRKRGILFGL